MTSQTELTFSPPRARRSDPETSHEAAASMHEAARQQRAQIVAALERAGVRGLTADELDERLGWRPSTAGRRLKELAELGLVERTALRRLTRQGRGAAVYLLR